MIVILSQVNKVVKCCSLSETEESKQVVFKELIHCQGNEEEVLNSFIKKKFLNNLYASQVNEQDVSASGERTTSHLNEQMTIVLKDETQDKEVSNGYCYVFITPGLMMPCI